MDLFKGLLHSKDVDEVEEGLAEGRSYYQIEWNKQMGYVKLNEPQILLED